MFISIVIPSCSKQKHKTIWRFASKLIFSFIAMHSVIAIELPCCLTSPLTDSDRFIISRICQFDPQWENHLKLMCHRWSHPSPFQERFHFERLRKKFAFHHVQAVNINRDIKAVTQPKLIKVGEKRCGKCSSVANLSLMKTVLTTFAPPRSDNFSIAFNKILIFFATTAFCARHNFNEFY